MLVQTKKSICMECYRPTLRNVISLRCVGVNVKWDGCSAGVYGVRLIKKKGLLVGPAGICEACAPGIPAGFKQPQLHKKAGWRVGGQVSLGGVIVWNKKMMKGCFFPLDVRFFMKVTFDWGKLKVQTMKYFSTKDFSSWFLKNLMIQLHFILIFAHLWLPSTTVKLSEVVDKL